MYIELRFGGISSIQIDKSRVEDARRAKACDQTITRSPNMR